MLIGSQRDIGRRDTMRVRCCFAMFKDTRKF